MSIIIDSKLELLKELVLESKVPEEIAIHINHTMTNQFSTTEELLQARKVLAEKLDYERRLLDYWKSTDGFDEANDEARKFSESDMEAFVRYVVDNTNLSLARPLSVKDWLKSRDESKVFTPSLGSMYYFIDDSLEVLITQLSENTVNHSKRVKNHNCFQAELTAKEVANKVKILLAINAWKCKNDNVALDWSDPVERKWYLTYNTDFKKYEVLYENTRRDLLQVYFSSERVAYECLNYLASLDLIR